VIFNRFLLAVSLTLLLSEADYYLFVVAFIWTTAISVRYL